MADEESVLLAIHNQEVTLKSRLRTARKRAEQRIAEAHREAEARLQEVEAEGKQLAATHYLDGVARAKEKAARIVAEAQREAEALRASRRDSLSSAAQGILRLILPPSQ